MPGPFPAPPPKPGKSALGTRLSNLNRVLRTTSVAMQDMGLQWNPKKCTVIHVRKGKLAKDAADLKLEETALVENFKTEAKYKGVRESVVQDEKLALTVAARTVIARALNNLNKPSVRLQPRQGNKPVHVACLEVPDVDPARN